jgi:hypothetical protein
MDAVDAHDAIEKTASAPSRRTVLAVAAGAVAGDTLMAGTPAEAVAPQAPAGGRQELTP